jgi:DHA1 family bicyclomycin/chloramphenicol resistance-like MFS transporter
VLLFVASAAHAPLACILIPLFFAVASVGLVSTTASSLALQGQGQVAGSASALIGTFQQLLGSISGPLSGLGGPVSALPMGGVICACEALALIGYAVLVRNRRKACPVA